MERWFVSSICSVIIIFFFSRPSSNRLYEASVAGVTAIGGQVKDLGVISTPVLHFVVTCHNDSGL